ncbi:MAG: polyphosphate kinase 2 family protein [Planctomycetaceae bacterium]
MSHSHQIDPTPYHVLPGTVVRLSEYATGHRNEFEQKAEAKNSLKTAIEALKASQQILWADKRYAVLIILQALDAAGKDGTIKHVMSGVNPQGCEVHSFGPPSTEELGHHFLWRPTRYLPAKGRIGIFNRSYYEETLVVRVHPELLEPQNLPPGPRDQRFWQKRFEDINSFEHSLHRNGTLVLKFFLHVSRDEQKRRFLKRLNNPQKHWKFNARDIEERGHWDEYMRYYEEMLTATSSEWASWYVVPADDKWFTRACVADIIAARIDDLDLSYPVVSDEEKRLLAESKERLLAEPDG